MRKILVWHQGALGDLILSLPSLNAIRTSRKYHYLHLVSRDDLADIIVRNRIADEVTPNETGMFSDLFIDGAAVSSSLRDFLAGTEEAFIFARRKDEVFMNNIGSCVPGTFFVETVPSEGPGKHVAEHQMDQLKSAGIDPAEMRALAAPEDCLPPLTGKRNVVIHPGSGGRKKRWPLGKFLDLALSLDSAHSLDVFLIFGPAEDHAMIDRTRAYLSREGAGISIYSDISVSEAASLIKGSSLFIGNDSGVTHLASVLGTPCLALFGPTDYRVWGPFGKNVSIIRSRYPCSPCRDDKYRACPCALCMERLKTEEVLQAAESLLNKDVK